MSKKEFKTTTEASLRKMAGSGMSIKDISEQLGCHYSYVFGAMAVLGIKTQTPTKKPAKAEAYAALRRAGYSAKQVAELFGVSESTVYVSTTRFKSNAAINTGKDQPIGQAETAGIGEESCSAVPA